MTADVPGILRCDTMDTPGGVFMECQLARLTSHMTVLQCRSFKDPLNWSLCCLFVLGIIGSVTRFDVEVFRNTGNFRMPSRLLEEG